MVARLITGTRNSSSGCGRLAAIAALMLIFFGVFAFLEIGRWLVVEDTLSPSGAILVLSGSIPYRAEEAARLFRAGYAPQVWLTRAIGVDQEVSSLGVEYHGEEFYNQEILEKLGVPAAAIHVLAPPIVNTADEMRVAAEEMRRDSLSQIIIVTSPPHTRRVRMLWKRLAPSRRSIVIRAAWDDPFDAAHWWRNTRNVNAVTREVMGLLNAWVGRPIPPQSP
jgi:uncharacterized SAM-binding protein YcdF (DUF218 family)